METLNQPTRIWIFLDDQTEPLGSYIPPVHFDLDTSRIPDGLHSLKIISQSPEGKEGVRLIPFTVRNGPAITIEGLQDHAIVDGRIPVMVNAYSKGDQKKFLLDGLETPRSIPSWIWVGLLSFAGWAVYYLADSLITTL